jgi:MFS family permease
MAFESLKGMPRALKVLVASALIENVAFGLIIPYLTIYMVTKLEISESLAGVALAGYTLTSIPAMIIGGMLADKIGRRIVLLLSLSLMSITMMMYFFAFDFWSLFIVILADAFVGSLYMPAANAMIADVVPSKDRPKSFSMIRIAWNVGMFVGPAIGVFIVASYSIRELFLFGSAILAGAFVMNVVFIPETRPAKLVSEEVTFRKVLRVADNRPFLLLSSMIGAFWLVLAQWMSVLQIYATKDLELGDNVPGILFALNGVMVVSLQLWVTSKMVMYRRSGVMLAGQTIASVGFIMVFFAESIEMLVACVVVMTIGEMVYMSIVSAVIADMAPETERGIYMGFSGFVQNIFFGVGFLFGMWLLDTIPDRQFVWPIFGLIGLLAAPGYLLLARIVKPEINYPHQLTVD